MPASVIARPRNYAQCTSRSSLPKSHAKEIVHLTVKPVALMKDLIKVFASPGAKILDVFMGSGSTGVAAILRHDFIGFEINPQHYITAKQRIDATVKEQQRKHRAAWKKVKVAVAAK
jgi:DNA modification methylase